MSDPVKGPGGRPTKYDPAFCDIVAEKMAEGFSKTAVAGFLKISRDTLLEWSKEHVEFSGAVKIGEAARTLKLETDLLSAPDGPNVTSRIFALKNAAPDEWKDNRALELTGADRGPIQHEDVTFGADAFARRVAMLAARHAGEGNGEPDAGSEGAA